MSLLRIAARVAAHTYREAGRTDVVRAVDAVFSNANIYPPRMKQTGQDTYEGEIDAGYNLIVKEKSDGSLDVKLNHQSVQGLDKAVELYNSWKSKGGPPSPSSGDGDLEKKVWQHLYGRSRPWVYGKIPADADPDAYADATEYQEQHPEDAAGSQLFWGAFEDLDYVDWSPVSDPEKVIKKTREIAEELKKQGLHVDPNRAEQQARRNWEEYKEKYLEGHIHDLLDNEVITSEDLAIHGNDATHESFL